MGLLGSSDFLKKEVFPSKQIAAYVNFDMVGRLKDNQLTLQAVGSSSIWPRLRRAAERRRRDWCGSNPKSTA